MSGLTCRSAARLFGFSVPGLRGLPEVEVLDVLDLPEYPLGDAGPLHHLEEAEDGGQDVVEVFEAGLGQHHGDGEDAVGGVVLKAVAGVPRGEAERPDLGGNSIDSGHFSG